MRGKIAILLLALSVSTPLSVRATNGSDAAALNVISEAYAPYRMSLSYLRAGETDLSGVLLQQFIDKWQQMAKAWTADPPVPFASDKQLKNSLGEILRTAQDAQVQLNAGDTSKATATLVRIRGMVGDIRHRNGIRTLSDCIDDISSKMDALWALRQSKFDSHNSSQAKQASAIVASLGPIVERCGQHRPSQNGEQFARLIHQASSSLSGAKDALAAQDTDRFIRIVRELHSIDNILFQQFD